MSLRARITLIFSACFLVVATVLVLEGSRREAAFAARHETTQLLGLRVSWSGLENTEIQRMRGHMRTLQRSQAVREAFVNPDAGVFARETVTVRSDRNLTGFQAIAPDGSVLFELRADEPGPAVLPPETIARLISQASEFEGLVEVDIDGPGLIYALVEPVFARSRVVGVAVLYSDADLMLAELSNTFSAPMLLSSPDGRMLSDAGTALVGLDQVMPAVVDAASDQLIIIDEGDRVTRAITVALPSVFMAQPARLIALQDISTETSQRNTINMVSSFALISGLVLFLGFINWVMRSSFRPLNAVIYSLNALSAGRTEVNVNVPERKDEIGRLAGTFETFRKSIQARKRLDRLKQELDVATRIQQQCLPSSFPEDDHLSFAASMVPMREVGGDFYDVFRLEDGRIVCVMADVSDKGVGAALFMAISRTVVRSTALSTPDPAECIRRVNAYLCEDNEAMLFVTMFYAVIDLDANTVHYANAGHNPPALIDADGNVSFIMSDVQPALGVWDEYDYEGDTLALPPGSKLFFYTDGITEAMDPRSAEFGEDRLAESLAKVAHGDVDVLIDAVTGAVADFAKDAPQSDDITCLAVAYKPA